MYSCCNWICCCWFRIEHAMQTAQPPTASAGRTLRTIVAHILIESITSRHALCSFAGIERTNQRNPYHRPNRMTNVLKTNLCSHFLPSTVGFTMHTLNLIWCSDDLLYHEYLGTEHCVNCACCNYLNQMQHFDSPTPTKSNAIALWMSLILILLSMTWMT